MGFDLKAWLAQQWTFASAETRRLAVTGLVFFTSGYLRAAAGILPGCGIVGLLVDFGVAYVGYRLAQQYVR